MDGFINIFKPKGYTSHDVVNILKRSFRKEKIGHGGTLDPEATGVLPICIGKGTKLQDYVMGLTKKYRAEIIFGYDSPTLDMDGEYVAVDDAFLLDEDKLKDVLSTFQGTMLQMPPMVSAIKKDGVPLYRLAQKGIEVPRTPREITIHSLALQCIKQEKFPKIIIDVVCSKGTYIRALARDIGESLGTKAIIKDLTRVSTGAFGFDTTYTMEDIAAMVEAGDYSFLLPMDALLTEMPSVVVKDMSEIQKVLYGNSINAMIPQDVDIVKIMDGNGILLALGKRETENTVKSHKVLFSFKKRKQPMEEWNSWQDTEDLSQNTAVALGNFDGVHWGHKYLMDQLAKNAELRNLKSVVVTFFPHPRDYFNQGNYSYLQTRREKIKHIEKTGVDAVFFMPFDEMLKETSPRCFVDEVVKKRLRGKEIYVGSDFRFGKNAEGTGKWLKENEEELNINVYLLDEVLYKGEKIGSSAIKSALKDGDLGKANGMLGYAYQCSGEVVYGKQLGRTIGFPTANVSVSTTIVLPGNGIYITWITYRGKRHPSVTNVGNCPTVARGLELTVEVHVLDDTPDLYGERVEVTFIRRIRGEEQFPDFAALKLKIEEDAAYARSFFMKKDQEE